MLALPERRAEVVGELGMGWLFAGEPPPAPRPRLPGSQPNWGEAA